MNGHPLVKIIQFLRALAWTVDGDGDGWRNGFGIRVKKPRSGRGQGRSPEGYGRSNKLYTTNYRYLIGRTIDYID